jgi:tRNA A-37 threonylcarbamoyl transferase component Bud32/tetratricopeptide (TPR) repeat protein
LTGGESFAIIKGRYDYLAGLKKNIYSPKSGKMKNIGKYKITSILGKGAMGIVYRALDPDINREVAVKTIRFDLISEEDDREEMMERFMREAQAAGKLTHSNIITIYDVGREKDMTYIVMQLIEGQSLQKVISSGEKISTQEVTQLMDQLCKALDYAHDNGIIHRDIKPANILLDKEGKPFIVDFGVARLETSTLTEAGTTLGTPSYMSPEQVMGKKVDRRSDIFSLGSILYELLTGKRAFQAQNITTVIYKIINEEPVALTEVKKGLPIGFEQIVCKALVKDPKYRYQTCSELATDLHNFDQLTDKKIPVAMIKEELPILMMKKKRKVWPIIAISAAAILLAAAGGGYYLYQKTGEIPFLSGMFKGVKAEEPALSPPPEAAVPGSLEDKLNRVKESFDKEDYAETVRLAEEVLVEDAENVRAQEYLNEAKSKMGETLIAQTPGTEEINTETPSLTRDKKPDVTEAEKKIETERPPQPLQTRAIIPGSTEDKLNRADERFEKGDYDETIRLAEEVIAKYPKNKAAQDYITKAKNEIMIAQTLEAGISSYKNRDYRQCLQEMEKILELNKDHKEAKKYWNWADKAIYEANSTTEIRQIIESLRKAEEEKDLPAILYYVGFPDLQSAKRSDTMDIFNYYDDITSIVDKASISIRFKDRRHADVKFSNFSTAVNKQTGQRTKVFEGQVIWTMEKQGNVWKITKEDKI